ncbi:glycosyltransferase [Succinimonas sp.]|uniref:glycosyltransferase n=1 Tax=Succinimonas sp. TaxID=1936151 RepID=UPI0038683489
MKNNCYKFSVVFLTLNAEPYLRNNLQNIESQTLKPIEVLVIDSESVDNTIHIAR